MNRSLVILAAVGLIALGSLVTFLFMRRDAASGRLSDGGRGQAVSKVGPDASASKEDRAPGSAQLPDITITLTPEAVGRAGIVVVRVDSPPTAGGLRVPAIVEPNAYRSVVVTPAAAGRVTGVSAELGEAVKRGQTLAQIYTPELADAQSRYLAAHAELDAHDRELRRTERLVELGSASRQELERVHAEHTGAVAMVGSLRSRLLLLGMTESQVDKLSSGSPVTSTIAVAAPIDGVVTSRAANMGLNVDPATHLFTVVDLSTVWLVGDVYERDLARVQVGTPVTVTPTAYPQLTIDGTINYVDTEINAATRTARVRAELPNPGGQLRLGMYAHMQVGAVPSPESTGSLTSGVIVPREAVQTIGERSVVYIADAARTGRFIEREVQLGATAGADIEITRGVQRGDSIVAKGSFALRAERERLGLRPAAGATQPAPAAIPSTRVTVSDKGFEPSRVSANAGALLRLTFLRTSDATCATEVTIPSVGITRALPLNQPVDVEITPQRSGEIVFACGMDMFRGTIVVR